MKEIKREDDLKDFQKLTLQDILILPQELKSGILEAAEEYQHVGWGFRVFRNNYGDYAIVPEYGKWWQDEMGNLQVIQFNFNRIN